MYCDSPACANFIRPVVFRQLFDQESSTYTYLLADNQTKDALLIDPVLEQVDRDAQIVKELGFDLKFALNTHVHADHVTGSGVLRKKYFPNLKSVLGETGNEDSIADIKLKQGEVFTMGAVKLECVSTSGHTNGCHCFISRDLKIVFTGDTVLIRGCGRTDFQQGSAENLYQNIWSKVFSLPEEFLVYPAHDYKGRTASSIGEEKKHNPRLTKTMPEFVELMKNLNLPYPKKIDVSVPMNRVCGLYELLSPEAAAKLAAATNTAGTGGNCSGETAKGGNCSGESAKAGNCSGEASTSGPASLEALRAAVVQKAVIVDVRGDPGEDLKVAAPGAVSCPWSRENQTMPLEGLPEDKNTLMIVHCARGMRASAAINFLKAQGYTNLINGAGPLEPAHWEVYGN